MRFDILTIFPGFFSGIFEHGIVRRALAEERVRIGVHDLRAFTHDRHRTVDDRPFGGGEGMVMKPEPIAEALTALGIAPKATRILALADPLAPANPSAPFPSAPVKGTGFSPYIEDAEESGALAPEGNLASDSTFTNSPAPTDPSAPVKGTGFSPYIEDAEESGALAPEGSFVKGTGFSPYIEDAEESGALAPEGNTATDSNSASRTRVILLSAQGKPFTQAIARDLAALDHIALICGRYEGVDERVNLLYCDLELSIGDYVLSGGELAAAVVVDAASRLVPGVLGNEASREFESFGAADAEIETDRDGVPRSQHGAGGLLDYPHYTRPAEFGGLKAPEVLLNGDHRQIRRWRREQQLRKTLANRPDLLEHAVLSKEDVKVLDAIRRENSSITSEAI
jgi:tRNA (guanine37-N1)-methyltransferase